MATSRARTAEDTRTEEDIARIIEDVASTTRAQEDRPIAAHTTQTIHKTLQEWLKTLSELAWCSEKHRSTMHVEVVTSLVQWYDLQ
jgi:hypothetical protein